MKLFLNCAILVLLLSAAGRREGLSIRVDPTAPRPVAVVAHRGASGYLPEHTLEAKVLAFMHSDYLEQDLVLTRDNVPIVLHDIYLDEVTDVAAKFPNRGRFLAAKNVTKFYAIDFDFVEIKTLQVSERFREHKNGVQMAVFPSRFPLWRSSFQLHSFEEELELINGLYESLSAASRLETGMDVPVVNRPGVYVELKRPEFHSFSGKGNFSEIVLNLLDKFNYTIDTRRKAIVQSFDPAELKRIKRDLGCQLPLVQLLSPRSGGDLEGLHKVNYTYWTSADGLAEIQAFAHGIGPEKDQLISVDDEGRVLPSPLLLEAKRLGLLVHPYTFRADALPSYVKSYAALMRLFVDELGVDGVFTDFPDLTRRYLDARTVAPSSSTRPTHSLSLLALFLGLLTFISNLNR